MATPRNIFFLVFALILIHPDLDAHVEHPLGKTELNFHPDEAIDRVLAMNIDFHGGDWFVIWRAMGRVEERAGKKCLVGPYFFFDVDDEFAFNIDETITLEVLVDRTETDGFNVSYDHVVNPTPKYYRLEPDFTERWETVTVELERARFANRKYEKTDFAIGALGARHPQPKDVNGEITICGLKVIRKAGGETKERGQGQFKLTIQNELGDSDTARVGLYDTDGRSPLTSDDAVTLIPFSDPFNEWPLINRIAGWPSEGKYVFYVDDEYTATVPEGEYSLVVYKGPEYELVHEKINIVDGEALNKTVQLKRWTHMPKKGWYSADAHIHIARQTPLLNQSILAFTKAEDIHLSNLLQTSNVGMNDGYPQYAWGEDGYYIDGHHALVSGQESPRTSHRGHTIGLDITQYHWQAKNYFVYDQVIEQLHDDGGLWGYAHVALDAFNVGYGLALDVALGIVDFAEILQMGMINTDYYYDFLNLGYKMLPAAGSDFPFILMAGSERMYAKVNGEFSPDAWFDAWRDGRSFVTNGPMLEFSINDDEHSSEFNVTKDDTLVIKATASVNPAIDQLSRIELVVHGEAQAVTISEAGSGELRLNTKFSPEESCWLAVRAWGKHGTIAHSAPVYIYVDNEKRFWKREAVGEISAKYIDLLKAFGRSQPNLDEDWERSDTENTLMKSWQTSQPTLNKRVAKAISVYEQLFEEANAKN